MSGLPESEPLGSLVEEASRLFAAAQVWARRAGGEAAAAESAAHGRGWASDSAACAVCPLCQVIALLRGDRPELIARLSEIAAGLLGVLGEALAAHEHSAGHGTRDSPEDPPGRLQPIDLTGTV